MDCPICNSETRVLRTVDNERRRECTRCKHRFTTVEQEKERVTVTDTIVANLKELIGQLQPDGTK